MTRWHDIALVTGKKGLDGRLVLEGDPAFYAYMPLGTSLWFVPPEIDLPRNLAIASMHEEGTGKLIVAFEGLDDAAAADAYVGKHCLIDRADICDRGVLNEATAANPVEDYVGYVLFDTEGVRLGRVKAIQARPVQPLLVLADEADFDKEHLIPFVDEYVVATDNEHKTMTLDLPKGLLEL